MTYTLLAGLGVVLAVAWDRWLLRTRLLATTDFWLSYALLVVFQLLANGLLTGLRVVRYDPATILGPRIAYAPIEDLAFGFALILVTLSCWTRLSRSPSRDRR